MNHVIDMEAMVGEAGVPAKRDVLASELSVDARMRDKHRDCEALHVVGLVVKQLQKFLLQLWLECVHLFLKKFGMQCVLAPVLHLLGLDALYKT